MHVYSFLLLCVVLGAAASIITLEEIHRLLPECALACLAREVLRHNCALDDLLCHCRNIEPIIKTVSPCLVEAGCSLQNLTATGRVIFNVCTTLPDGNETATKTFEPTPTVTPTVVVSEAANIAAVLSGWMGLFAVAVMTVYL